MLVKTFHAGSMSEALRMVKTELGADAMIISSREERRKGILGFFRKPVFEITAAVDQAPRSRRPAANPYTEPGEELSNTRQEFQKSMLEPLVREIRELKDRVDSMTSGVKKSPENVEKRPEKIEPVSAAGRDDEFVPLDGARPDMKKLRELLIETVSGKFPKKTGPAAETGAGRNSGVSGAEADAASSEGRVAHEKLLDELKLAGLDKVFRGKLMEAVAHLPEGETAAARSALRDSLAAMVRCSGSAKSRRKGPRMVALVGPTGVGKTTTIAKLAAMYALKRKAKVALVTTDTFRAGAVEQLRTYANILKVPMETAAMKNELEKALQKHSDKDVILIDTAGKSALESGKLDDLAVLLGADSGIEKHLCLSATTRDEDLQGIVERFRDLPVQRVVFTKLDESRKLGCLVNVNLHNNLPLSYVTNGQRVPEDIEIASGKKIAAMVLGT